MATVKLTLSVPEHFVGQAKKYASKKHTSISKMFFELMSKELANNKDESTGDELLEKNGRFPVSAEVKALTGVIKNNYSDQEIDNLKYEYLSEKYGLK